MFKIKINEVLCDLELGKVNLDTKIKVWSIINKLINYILIKLKTLMSSKVILRKWKDQTQTDRKTFAQKIFLIKKLVPEYIKIPQKTIIKQVTPPQKKPLKTWIDSYIERANKHFKKCS